MDRQDLHEPFRLPWRGALESWAKIRGGHLNGHLNGPLRATRAVKASVQKALTKAPGTWTRETPRDPPRSVEPCTGRLVIRPGVPTRISLRVFPSFPTFSQLNLARLGLILSLKSVS